jgi:hypothetical protein
MHHAVSRMAGGSTLIVANRRSRFAIRRDAETTGSGGVHGGTGRGLPIWRLGGAGAIHRRDIYDDVR